MKEKGARSGEVRTIPRSCTDGETLGTRPANFEMECEREDDRRGIAEIPEIPGVMAYGASKEQTEIEALALTLSQGTRRHGIV